MKKQNGFGIIGVIIVVFAVGLIGFSGWYVVDRNDHTDGNTQRETSFEEQLEKAEITASNTGAEEPSIQEAMNEEKQVDSQSNGANKQVTESVEFYYQILSDGKTARASPTKVTVPGADNVKIVINLECEAGCQFRLNSDQQPIANSSIYTESTIIEYLLTKPGQHTLTNEFTPTVFLIEF